MENNSKKSKAFIIAFILMLILLLAGYYLYKNRTQIFDAKGSNLISKIFSPLFGNSDEKPIDVINEKPIQGTDPRVTGTITTDEFGNKIIMSEAGEDLQKGDVVYIAGFNSRNEPIVKKALASDKNKSLVFGIAGENISKGSTGKIMINGTLNGMTTNRKEGTLWATGNQLYLSSTIAGALTKNPPVNPSFIIPVGNVVKIDPINGSIHVGNLTSLITKDASGNKVINVEAGENIKKGDAVYISGFNASNQPIVMKAIANDKNKSLVLGAANQDISKGSTGNIIIDGILSGIGTNKKEGTLWGVGNPLYLSSTTAGAMTKNAPAKPSFMVMMGNVIKVDPTNGSVHIGSLANLVTFDANGDKLVLSEAGENIKKGDVVYISGFNSNNQPIVMKAISNDKSKSVVFGIAAEDISKGSTGNIIIEGNLSGINTNKKDGTTLWATGNQLYLSSTIAGAMTIVPPKNPAFIVPVGNIIKIDPINGSINFGNLSNIVTVDSNGNKVVLSEAGENIKKGDAVYIAGFNSNNQPIVMKAIANDATKSLVFGIAAEDILKGSLGYIIVDGTIGGIPTNKKEGTVWATGNQLYLSSTIAGALTKNPPANPAFIVPIGTVIVVDPVNGSINLKNLTNSNLWKSIFDNNMYTQMANGLSGLDSTFNTILLKDSSQDINSYWDSVFGSNSYKGNTFNSQDTFAQAEAGENIKKGDVVYISGYTSENMPIVMKAIAGDPTKSLVFGVAAEDISKGAVGNIIIGGNLSGLNTTKNEGGLWEAGSQLYLSTTTAGAMTITPPSNPAFIIPIGTITVIDPTNGSINLNFGNTNSASTWGPSWGLNFSNTSTSTGSSGWGSGWGTNWGNTSSSTSSLWGSGWNFGWGAWGNTSTSTNGGWGEFNLTPIDLPYTGGTTSTTTSTTGDCNYPKITDTETKQCINRADCVKPKQIILDKCESPENIETCEAPKIINVETNKCIDRKDCKDPMLIIDNKCQTPIVEPNKCLLIQQTPLEFTSEQKARLDVLLRRFYLISSSLRTNEDIVTIYNEIEQQQTFIRQTKQLSKQCYLETNNFAEFEDFCKRNKEFCYKNGNYATEFENNYNKNYNYSFETNDPDYGYSSVKHGNPWFTKTSGGISPNAFPYTKDAKGYTLDSWGGVSGHADFMTSTERILNIW